MLASTAFAWERLLPDGKVDVSTKFKIYDIISRALRVIIIQAYL